MEEVEHIIEVLESTKKALVANNALELKELSDQTIHSASVVQDAGSTTLAVLIYVLSKLIERKNNYKIKSWNKFVKKFNGFISLSILAVKENNQEKYENYLENARNSMATISVNLKPYIQEVIRKASINKASKIYEHGISMEQTAKLLGITQWELSEYTGQKNMTNYHKDLTLDVRKRALMALEFFS